jgi:Xaa-Pro dipeptidase
MLNVDDVALAPLYDEHLARLQSAYDDVLRAAGLDAVVLHSGTALKKSAFDDQYWPVTIVPHFRHWAPLAEADCALVVSPGSKPLLVRNVAHGFWEKPAPPERSFFWSRFDVVEAKSAAAMAAALPKGPRIAFVGEDQARAREWGFADEQLAPAAVLQQLDALRVLKTRYERACLAEANRRAARGHRAVLDAFRAGDRSELDLHLLYLQATAQDDPETPYKNIVALGEHAATLHHVGYGKEARAAQSLLLDAGATFLGYDSDITRTAVKGAGAAADAFGGLVAGVDALQQELCRRVKTGLPYEQLHDQSHELLAAAMKDVGIGVGSVDELVSSGVTRKFLPHGLGHSLGVQTHDVGCRQVAPAPKNPFLRNTSTIAPTQCFTIEPGCYFIDELLAELRASKHASLVDWKLVEALKPFGGVRIEDDLVVEDGGVDNLTRAHLPS